MTIGIDITSILYGRGVSRYTSNLVKALMTRGDTAVSLYGSSFRQHKELESIANELLEYAIEPDAHEVQIQKIPPSLLGFMWKFGFNKMTKVLSDISLFHSWDWIQPPDKKLPLVSTIHDLAILKFPETAHPKILKAHRRSWEILKEREAEIIAVSHATKKDIIQLLDIPSFKIHVIPEALPTEVQDTAEALTEDEYNQIRDRLSLNTPFIFFVGTREPRKNLKRLIEAWKPMANSFQLIIAGDKGWDETESGSTNPNLRFLGRVTDQELAVLYGEANVFAYPSLYEGFGLPVLESFYHGTPVVTSNTPAILEVAGNAAELVDPESIESINAGLQKVLSESIPDQQKRLQRMIIRRQMFNWDKVAEQTIQVYTHTLKNAEQTYG